MRCVPGWGAKRPIGRRCCGWVAQSKHARPIAIARPCRRSRAFLQDVRFALRQMRRAPGFTITAVLTLALGIGANAVIYTLVDSILLRPLPYAQQDRLMRVTGTTFVVVPRAGFARSRCNPRSFSSIAGYGDDVESNVSGSDMPERVFGASVTVNALDTLGIHPALGQFFSKDDEVPARITTSFSVTATFGAALQVRPPRSAARCASTASRAASSA